MYCGTEACEVLDRSTVPWFSIDAVRTAVEAADVTWEYVCALKRAILPSIVGTG